MNDDDTYDFAQRVTIVFDLHYGVAANAIAVRAMLSMLERLDDAGLHPRAASLHLAEIPTT